MSKLANLVLPVTYNNWNTYTYSPRINTLLSLSNDMGAIPQTIAYVPTPPQYLFDDIGQPIDHDDLVSKCRAIDGSDDLEQALVDMLTDMKDIEANDLSDSKRIRVKE